MKEIDDGFDLMITVLMLIIMLAVCTWSITSMKNSSEVLVEEKTSIHNVYGQAVAKPIQTAEDALMTLVVSDAYTTMPNTAVFKLGAASYTVKFDSSYFQDQEVSINKAWSDFFRDKMHTTIRSVTLDIAGNRWIIELTT